MCFAAVVVFVLYLMLFLLSRKEELQKSPGGLLKLFYRMAFYLYKRICAKRVPIAGQKQIMKDLQRLHPGENKELVCTDYYVGKIALMLAICLVGTILSTIISVEAKAEVLLGDDGSIARGTYEEGSKELDLAASFEDGTERYFSVQVGARRLTEQELDALFAEFATQLPLMILGENATLEEISTDLILEESYEGYPFWLEWYSSRPEIVASTGTVFGSDEEKVELVLRARIIYEEADECEREQEIPICVIPPVLTEESRFQQEMEEMLLADEQENRLETVWKLPEKFEGKKIYWRQVVTDYSLLIWAGVLLIAVLVFFLADKDVHDNLEAKRAGMKRSYPDVVQKLVLYMGAGLTVRGAFQRIAGNYEQDKRMGKAELAVYEEMLYSCRELQGGVSEGAVYEHFGKRTGLQEYIRLSTLLMQNLKKGNSTLLQRLREEADKACIEQLQNSRRMGEEASTKLLLPMVLMLVVVMLLIMIPAFSSVGI